MVEGPAETERFPADEPLRVAFERHYVRLHRLCLLLARRPEDAEEIAQETFVRIAPRITALAEEDVWPFLRTIALNVWRNRLRRLSAEVRARTRMGRSVTETTDLDFEERDQVRTAVGRLPPRQRACVVLRYFEDLPEVETAAVLRCSVGTVKSQTSRALAQLRKELEGGA